MSKTLKIEREERKYYGYHRKFPNKIPTEGMLKSPYEDQYLHQEPDGTWTDVDSHLVEIILGSGK